MAGMKIKVVVTVELNHTTGKFASKDEMIEKIKEDLENANPGSYSTDEDAEYEVADWSVDEV